MRSKNRPGHDGNGWTSNACGAAEHAGYRAAANPDHQKLEHEHEV